MPVWSIGLFNEFLNKGSKRFGKYGDRIVCRTREMQLDNLRNSTFPGSTTTTTAVELAPTYIQKLQSTSFQISGETPQLAVTQSRTCRNGNLQQIQQLKVPKETMVVTETKPSSSILWNARVVRRYILMNC